MRITHPQQRGGTFMGMVLGLVLGLGIALAVALYVTKAPIPFVDRGVMGADGGTEQAEKNANWNPNSGFNQNQPLSALPPSDAGEPATPTPGATPPAQATPSAPSAGGSDPLGDLIQARTTPQANGETKPLPTPLPAAREAGQVRELMFYVQAGAFGQVGDAENQRARLALMGVDARVSQDTVNERTVFRVRSGPYRTRAQALKTRQKLTDQNVETVIVAVPK